MRVHRALRKIITIGTTSALAAVGLVALTGVTPAFATVTTETGPAGALTIAHAMASPATNITGASFVAAPPNNGPDGISDAPVGPYFPSVAGSQFGILTTGRVASVPNAGFADYMDGGGAVHGDSAFDVSILKIDFTAPATANCLSFDFQFLSEEYPQYFQTQYNDAFIAELDTDSWTAHGSTISAPDNFAFDSSGHVVSINSTGLGGLSADNALGTAFDGNTNSGNTGGATGLLRATTQVSPGTHSLYFSIFDQADQQLDSAAFVDNLTVGFVADPATNCVPGAQPANYTLSLSPATGTDPVGAAHSVTATLTTSSGAAVPGAPISFSVAGANTSSGAKNTDTAGQAGFTYTGVNAGDDAITACYQPAGETSCAATASASETWQSSVTITADDQTKTYGDPDPPFSYTVSGLPPGTSLTTEPTCGVSGAHADAGTYPITCSGAVAPTGYDISYVPGTLTVKQTAITVTADNKSTTYGDADPAFTWTTSGLIGSDALTTNPTCSVAGAHAAAGSYPITCSGASAGPNYTVQYAPGTLTIGKAVVTVTADNKSKTYGDPDPAFTYSVAGLVGSDGIVTDPTCGVGGAHHDAGTYPITCSGASAGPNYTVQYAPGTLTVGKAVVTITADDRSKTYGDPDPSFTYSVAGLQQGDALVTNPTCGVSGTHNAAGAYPITCSGADAGPNYTIDYAPGVLSVTKATVIIAADDRSKTYGEPDPAFTYSVAGLRQGDALITDPACGVDGAHRDAGTYPITCAGADAGPNYTVHYVDGTLTVDKAIVTVTADNRTKTYGDPDPAFTWTTTGLVGSDALVTNPACGVDAEHHDAGTYPITCSGADAGPNYTVHYVDGTLTVDKAIVAVTADNQTKAYGDPDPAFTWTATGLLGSDGLVTDPACGVDAQHHDVGTYPITCSGADAGPNYTVHYVDGTLTVNPVPLTITADNATKTAGAPDPTFGFTVTGLVGSDTLVTAPACGVAGPHDTVGTYAITCAGADAGPNYRPISYVAGTLTVTKATPDITTTPSASVPAGGNVSDSATVTSPAHPTGSVTFSLYGPGDPTCQNAVAARTTKIGSSTTVDSGPVPTGAPGTYRWVATYSGDDNNYGVVSGCGDETVKVTPQTLTGRAYAVSASASLLGAQLALVPPTPDTGAVSTTATSSVGPKCLVSLPGVVAVDALCAAVQTSALMPTRSSASASVAAATIGIPTLPVITVKTVQATSTTACAGSAGRVTIAYLAVGSTVVIAAPTEVTPNTRIAVGPVSLTLNEQLPFTSPDRGLTVNAIHIRVDALGLAKTDVVIAHAESDIGNCP